MSPLFPIHFIPQFLINLSRSDPFLLILNDSSWLITEGLYISNQNHDLATYILLQLFVVLYTTYTLVRYIIYTFCSSSAFVLRSHCPEFFSHNCSQYRFRVSRSSFYAMTPFLISPNLNNIVIWTPLALCLPFLGHFTLPVWFYL